MVFPFHKEKGAHEWEYRLGRFLGYMTSAANYALRLHQRQLGKGLLDTSHPPFQPVVQLLDQCVKKFMLLEVNQVICQKNF